VFKIMIVDDVEVIRKEIKRLKIWGEETGFYIAGEARNGQEALELLKANPVDLVITDIRMPKINGLELLNKIMEHKMAPCVVLLSEYGEFEYARQGLVSGAIDYLVKPVKAEEFVAMLQRVKIFLLNQKIDMERMVRLKSIAEEKLETIYPAADIQLITGLIARGDKRAVDAVSHMVETTVAACDNEMLKASLLLKNIIMEIINSILDKCAWLSKFIAGGIAESIDYSNHQDVVDFQSALMKATEYLVARVSKLMPDVEGSDMVYQVCLYVLNNVDSEITLKGISDNYYINSSYLSTVFKQKTKITVKDYIIMVKMERAKKLILDGDLKSYEIAGRLGYRDFEYFGKLFKKNTGLSPTEYRQRGVAAAGE